MRENSCGVCVEYFCELRYCTAHTCFFIQGQTTHDITMGNIPGIINFIQDSWYDLVYYQYSEDRLPSDEGENIGHWLGFPH